MNESAETPFNPQDEIKEVRSQIEILEETSGWNSLTKMQKKMMRTSLYVQKRVERTTDEQSVFAIEVTDRVRIARDNTLRIKSRFDTRIKPDERKYKESQDHISRMGCHDAVNSIENQRVVRGDLSKDFFKATYSEVKNAEELKALIQDEGEFPLVGHVSGDGESRATFWKAHTFIILGKDGSGNLLVWDKRGPGMSYRVIPIDDLYSQQMKMKDERVKVYWGLRPLRNIREDVESEDLTTAE